MAAPPAASNHAFSITARAAGQAIAQLSVGNGEESEKGKEGLEAENSCIPGKTWKNTESCEAPEWPECRESPSTQLCSDLWLQEAINHLVWLLLKVAVGKAAKVESKALMAGCRARPPVFL